MERGTLVVEIKIFNRNQIGGNFTVVDCNGKRVMFDYGEALPGTTALQEEYDWEKHPVEAVFFTHYHGDHVGRMLEIPNDVPLFMGSVARKVMLNIHRALSKIPELKEEELKYIQLLEDDARIHEIKENVPCKKIEDIEVIPYSVDHSAYDSYMFLIKTPDENILHTGDFREHGYRGNKMVDVIKKYVLPKADGHIETLIIEGTMMERQDEKVMTEYELKKKAGEYFEENKYAFLVCSSTNLDTLASYHKAALEKKMYTYCYNRYLLGQLETFTETAGERSDLYKFEKTYLVELDKKFKHKYWKEPKTQEQMMRENGFLCIIKPGKKYAEWIERFRDLNPKIYYAMWNGYIDSEKDAYNEEWAEFFAPYIENGQFVELHTSGHATPKTIAKIIETVKPTKRIYPMHTGNAEGFLLLDVDEKYKRMLDMSETKLCKGEQPMELTKEEKEVLEAMKDHRYIEKDLFNAFLSGGLSEFRKFVLDHNKGCEKSDKIAVLLRGNDNKIIVYYRNHKVWELSVSNKKCRVAFDFNHARYNADWEQILEELMEKGFCYAVDRVPKERLASYPAMIVDRNKKDVIIGGKVGSIKCDKDFFTDTFVKESFEIITGLIANFFDVDKNIDYFRKKVEKELNIKITVKETAANPLIEKRWQQRLFFEYKDLKDGLYVYDLEFSQPFPAAKFVEAQAKGKENKEAYMEITADSLKKKLGTNSPDMFAIRFEDDKPVSLVMLEVKSTESADKGESNIEKHLVGMKAYAKQEIFMKNRIKDAMKILKQFQEFGFIKADIKIPEIPMDIEVENILLLTNNYLSEEERGKKTGGALKYYEEQAKERIDKCAEKNNCQIWLTDSIYTSKEIKVMKN